MKPAHHFIGTINAAAKAGEAIMEVYQSDFAVEAKVEQSRQIHTIVGSRSHGT